jgi:hypothetical protein
VQDLLCFSLRCKKDKTCTDKVMGHGEARGFTMPRLGNLIAKEIHAKFTEK